jgi:hypothetical protein
VEQWNVHSSSGYWPGNTARQGDEEIVFVSLRK